jgi:hypothetical protein
MAQFIGQLLDGDTRLSGRCPRFGPDVQSLDRVVYIPSVNKPREVPEVVQYSDRTERPRLRHQECGKKQLSV